MTRKQRNSGNQDRLEAELREQNAQAEAIRRFGYVIRNGDNTLVEVVGGIATRAEAATLAQQKRDEIAQRGWDMYVLVTEEHQIVRD